MKCRFSPSDLLFHRKLKTRMPALLKSDVKHLRDLQMCKVTGKEKQK